MSKRSYSKIDSARTQLDQAINLYFNDGDAISIHTLIGAATGILNGLLKRAGKKSSEENFIERVKPEYRKSMREILRKYQNFFKHADKDPDALIEFDDDLNELTLFVAINDFRELTGIVSEDMDVYALWYISHNPDSIIMPENPEVNEWKEQLRKSAAPLDKEYFYKNARQLPNSDKIFPYFYKPNVVEPGT